MSETRVAIVTGAGQGIGQAISLDLAGAGAAVIAADVNLEAAQGTARQAVDLGVKATAVQVDVSDPAAAQAMAEAAMDEFGRIDYLVNNAGITRDTLMMRMDDDAWKLVIDINLNGTSYCSRAVLRPMMKQRFGRIVNISSVVGAMGNAGQTNYAASKAGVMGLTRALAREVASRNITVNAVAPGYIQTAMTEALSDKARQELVNLIPSQRLGTPQDVAGAVRFLLSDEASYITGQVIHVNGGMYM